MIWLSLLTLAFSAAQAQSGHSSRSTVGLDGTILSVTALRTDKSASPIRAENLYLYENAIEQKIKKHLF